MTEAVDEKSELRDRVDAKRKKVEARLSELKADTRSEAREEEKKLRSKLDSIEETVKSGWSDLSDAVAAKVNRWLKDD